MEHDLIDSHVNLHSSEFAADIDEVIARAREAGVTRMLTISDKLGSTEAIRRISQKCEGIWRSVGAHPHYAGDHTAVSAGDIIALSVEPDVIGVGECGLDFYYNHSARLDQERLFAAHVEASQETGLPLIVHTRDADEEMLTRLSSAMSLRQFPFLLHCFTGGARLAAAAIEMGGYVSFSGIITFKNADAVRAIARSVPIDRILIETDCPYLAPVPFRGRRNEPSFLPFVAAKIAELHDVSVSVVAQQTENNFFRLFTRAERGAIGRGAGEACSEKLISPGNVHG